MCVYVCVFNSFGKSTRMLLLCQNTWAFIRLLIHTAPFSQKVCWSLQCHLVRGTGQCGVGVSFGVSSLCHCYYLCYLGDTLHSLISLFVKENKYLLLQPSHHGHHMKLCGNKSHPSALSAICPFSFRNPIYFTGFAHITFFTMLLAFKCLTEILLCLKLFPGYVLLNTLWSDEILKPNCFICSS